MSEASLTYNEIGFPKPNIHTTCYLKFRIQVESNGTQGNFCFIVKTQKRFVSKKMVIKIDAFLIPPSNITTNICNPSQNKKITL